MNNSTGVQGLSAELKGKCKSNQGDAGGGTRVTGARLGETRWLAPVRGRGRLRIATSDEL